MMRGLFACTLLTVCPLMAQTGITNASVSGMVKDKTTGKPLENYTVATSVNVIWVGDSVMQNSRSKDVSVTTDSTGTYKLKDLPPASYRISARSAERFGGQVTRYVAVNGSDVEHIDFLITLAGTITGKVVDENKEPVTDVAVRLVKREYYLGNLGYYYAVIGGNTNDLGEFTLSGVEPGQSHFLMAEKVERSLPAHSQVPVNPKLRKLIPVRTWYPNSPSRDAAQAIVLQPGEKREGVDIELRKLQSYCVEGIASGPMGPAKVRFGIEATQPSMGTSSTGGIFFMTPGGLTAPDGQFRICDLYPGGYRLSVQDADYNASTPIYGAIEVAITDKDLRGVTVAAVPGKTLTGEVVWDVDPPATPVTNKVSVALYPLFRANFRGERAFARIDIPGPFTIDGAFPEDAYAVHPFFSAPGMYVKDITFSGNSVMYQPFRSGDAMGGAGFRVTMAHDGATLNVQVNDKDGNPCADLRVLVLPAETRSEGELAARLVKGQTNQLGQYTTQTLPPGKYYVVATEESVDPTPESIGRLWRSRNRYQEVNLPPAGSAQVKLEPGKIE